MARRGPGVANLAVAVEQRARLDHELGDGDVTIHTSARDDLETVCRHVALETTADHDAVRAQIALNPAAFADGHLRLGANRPLDFAVDVQVVAQGEVADKLCTCCNDGRSGRFAAVRTTSVNDSH